MKSALEAMAGLAPRDELEGMMAAQLLAAHNAAMECYRRAMHSEQTFEGRRENLNQANKLSRSSAVLLEALQSPPRQGPAEGHGRAGHCQRRRSGHRRRRFHPGGGVARKSEEQPHALTHAPGSRCGARTRRANSCRAPAMPNGRCRLHGGKSTGAPKGNKNALKHGGHSASERARRALMRYLLSGAN